jgi:Tfp pilus assembly protein FimV
VKPTFPALFLMLATTLDAGATPAAASAAASAPVPATRAASALCAPQAASRPMRGHQVTSRVRGKLDASDPCADPTGATPPPRR